MQSTNFKKLVYGKAAFIMFWFKVSKAKWLR